MPDHGVATRFRGVRVLLRKPAASGSRATRQTILRASCALALLLSPVACSPPAAAVASRAPDWDAERRRMVDEQLRARDITSPRVLAAMAKVPRHLFVPEPYRDRAYGDHPLPIGFEQTISQPYIVAFMTQALDVQRSHRVLEIGTGSAYQAAVLGELTDAVHTIEIVAPLADRARETLQALGYRHVHVRTGNGYLGWPEQAPFDRIIVTAAPPEIPPALVAQLSVGGLMAIPVGTTDQQLQILRKTPGGMQTIRTLPVRFVPMTGKPR
jgi:protein-L-isoaspartate(D-aspartate) O-methyltransferase